ncbi:MAG: choice-of-anchor B family protein [Ardenticatenaceae bacterium]
MNGVSNRYDLVIGRVAISLLLAFLALYTLHLPARSEAPAPGRSAVTCENGLAGEYPCENVDFLSFMSLAELGATSDEAEGANVWGWTDPETNKEYVMMGLTDGTAFVDISQPENPVYVGRLPTHNNISSDKYRDMKVYKDHAFIIADLYSQHGMQVFDLTQLRDVMTPTITFTETAYFNGFGNAHNIHINQESGYAYVLRATSPDYCSGAMYMVNIQDPSNPTEAGCFSEGSLASDTMCVNYHGNDPDYQGKEVCILASDDDIIIADVTDKANPVNLTTVGYPDIRRAHNAWLTADHNYFVTSDMNDEMMLGLDTRIFVWDFTDVDNPQLIGTYVGPTPASDHNIWINDNYAYVGNFRAGVRILDLTDIANGNLTQAAYFDMVPGDNNTGHSAGAWAVYPYFANGVIAVSEKSNGLFLLRQTGIDPTAVSVSEFGSTSNTSGITLLMVLFGGVTLVLLRKRNK